MNTRIPLVTLLVIAISFSAFAANTQTAAERSHERALQILNAGIDALGGVKAVNAVERITLNSEAELTPRLQTPSYNPPYRPFKLEETVYYDLKGNRLTIDSAGSGNGFTNHNRTVFKDGEAQNFDLRARTVTPVQNAGSAQQVQQYYRRLPNLVLQTALQRETSLRYLGEETFDGRKQNVITFAHNDAQQIGLYFDAKTNLLTKYELIYPDALTGDDAAEIIYSSYTDANGVKVPSGWTWRQAGQEVGKFRYKVQINPTLDEKVFDVTDSGYTKVAAFTPPPVATEKLDEGVFLVERLGGGGYNVLAVDAGDYIVAVEAPLSTQVSEQAIAEIKKAIPNKPIKYVAITHFHSDHSGGLRAFINEGATVITTKGNQAYVEQLAAAKLDDALAKSGRKLALETFAGKRTLQIGDRTLELRDIGPNPHADEMVVAYLPKEGIVFQGDMFFAPFNDAPIGPAPEATAHFAGKVKDAGWKVNKLAGVHGRVSNMGELAKSLESQPAVAAK